MGRRLKKIKSNSNTFSLRISELPDVLLNRITKEIEWFTTVLFLNGSFVGSGTLVSCDDTYGILTALHVIRKKHFDFSSRSSQRLGLNIAKHRHQFELEMKYLKLIEVGKPPDRNFGPFGPDVAFIKILNIDKLGTIKAKKSFFSISYKRNEKLKLSLEDEGIWAVSCCPEEFNVDEGPQGGFKKVIKLGGIGGFTEVDKRSESGNFDYIEVGTTYTDKTISPSTYEGASGGGLWKVLLKKKRGAALKDIDYENPILSGVIFYQTSKIKNRRNIRCHGGKTIYHNLYEKIKSCE